MKPRRPFISLLLIISLGVQNLAGEAAHDSGALSLLRTNVSSSGRLTQQALIPAILFGAALSFHPDVRAYEIHALHRVSETLAGPAGALNQATLLTWWMAHGVWERLRPGTPIRINKRPDTEGKIVEIHDEPFVSAEFPQGISEIDISEQPWQALLPSVMPRENLTPSKEPVNGLALAALATRLISKSPFDKPGRLQIPQSPEKLLRDLTKLLLMMDERLLFVRGEIRQTMSVRVAAFRKEKNLFQKQLSEKAGLGLRVVRLIENAELKSPSREYQHALAQVLEVPFEALADYRREDISQDEEHVLEQALEKLLQLYAFLIPIAAEAYGLSLEDFNHTKTYKGHYFLDAAAGKITLAIEAVKQVAETLHALSRGKTVTPVLRSLTEYQLVACNRQIDAIVREAFKRGTAKTGKTYGELANDNGISPGTLGGMQAYRYDRKMTPTVRALFAAMGLTEEEVMEPAASLLTERARLESQLRKFQEDARLAFIRKMDENRLSLNRFASMIGLHRSTAVEFQKGRHPIQPRHFYAWAKTLQVPLNYFWPEEDLTIFLFEATPAPQLLDSALPHSVSEGDRAGLDKVTGRSGTEASDPKGNLPALSSSFRENEDQGPDPRPFNAYDIKDKERILEEFIPLRSKLTRMYTDPSNPFLSSNELFHETGIILCDLINKFDPTRGVPLGGYLVVQLGQRMYTLARQHRINQSRQASVLNTDYSDVNVGYDPYEGVLERVAQEAVLEALPLGLTQLTERQASIFIGRYLEGKENKELAALYGIGEATVRSTLRHALAKLRKTMKNPEEAQETKRSAKNKKVMSST